LSKTYLQSENTFQDVPYDQQYIEGEIGKDTFVLAEFESQDYPFSVANKGNLSTSLNGNLGE